MNIDSIFLLILLFQFIKNSKNRLLSEYILSEDNCEEIENDCVKCNSPLNSCIYENGICTYFEDNNFSNFSNYSKLMNCNDDLTIEKMKGYCGKIIIDKDLNQAIISQSILNGNDSIEDLFCSWEIIQSKDIENVKIHFKNVNENVTLGIIIYDANNDSNTFYEIKDKFSIKLSKNNFKKMQIIYYHSDIPKVYPFDMTYKVKVGIKLSEIFIIIIISLGLIFIIISIITLINFIKKYSINKQFENNSNGIDIDKINTIKYTNELNIYNQICPICLEEFKNGTEIILLNCFHGFHFQCINSWVNNDLKNNKHCPICNLYIKKQFCEKTNDSDNYIND